MQLLEEFESKLGDRNRDRGDLAQRDAFLKKLTAENKLDDGEMQRDPGFCRDDGILYIETIKGLDAGTRALGTRWLQSVVKEGVEDNK